MLKTIANVIIANAMAWTIPIDGLVKIGVGLASIFYLTYKGLNERKKYKEEKNEPIKNNQQTDGMAQPSDSDHHITHKSADH